MRIVYIDDFFHPDAGYHMNLLSKYWALFGHEVILLTAEAEKTPDSLKSFFDYRDIEQKDRAFEEKNGVRIIRLPIRGVISGRAVYTRAIFDTIRRIEPDIVYCNGNDSLIGMQLTLRAAGAPYGLVLDSHMLEIASNNPYRKLYHAIYRRVFAPIVVRRRIPVIRTQDDDYIEKHLGIPLSMSPLISFGSDTLQFHPDEQARKAFRRDNGIAQDAFVVVYAGKLNAAKGVTLLWGLLEREFSARKELVFLIVGTPDASLPMAEAFFAQSRNRVIRFPTQKYTDLPVFYQASDLAIFPRQCSLSFFDVQSCGLPVVFEDNALNRVRSGAENAAVFKAGDVADFQAKVEAFANMEETAFERYRQNALRYIRENYDYADKAREYIAILETQLKHGEKKRGRG